MHFAGGGGGGATFDWSPSYVGRGVVGVGVFFFLFWGGGGGMHQPYAHESVIQAAWLGCVMCGSIAAAGTNSVSAAGL